MTNNPYLDEVERRYDLDDLAPDTLATLATAHELHEMNRLTAAMNTPTRTVANVQAPIAPGGMGARIMAIPDESEGDARIAAAARRWATQYARRTNPGRSGAALNLAAAELAEAVRQEDER